MDTYGHLLPDQHADAIGGMSAMMAEKGPLAATGTAGSATATEHAVEHAVGMPESAKPCEPMRADDESADMPHTLEFPRKSDDDQVENRSGPSRIRTCNQGIMSPTLHAKTLAF